MKEIKIQIKAKKCKKHDSDETFLVFSCYSEKTKKKYSVKFTKDVPNEMLPKRSGTITVLADHISVNNQKLFPEVWIDKIEKFEEYSSNVEDYFG